MTALRHLVADALRAATPTMEDLAQTLDLSTAALRSYRLGTRTPAPAFRRKFAKLLRNQAERLMRVATRLERKNP